MRAFKKRPWASLVVNMTPLIDVVFLIIIFFIMMINFSDLLARKITLPTADEAREMSSPTEVTVTIKSDTLVFVGRDRVALPNLAEALARKIADPRKCTVHLRGDENLPYTMVQKVMEHVARSGVSRIAFTTRREPVPPLGED